MRRLCDAWTPWRVWVLLSVALGSALALRGDVVVPATIVWLAGTALLAVRWLVDERA